MVLTMLILTIGWTVMASDGFGLLQPISTRF